MFIWLVPVFRICIAQLPVSFVFSWFCSIGIWYDLSVWVVLM